AKDELFIEPKLDWLLRPLAGSQAIGRGLRVPDAGSQDAFGAPLLPGKPPDIGAIHWPTHLSRRSDTEQISWGKLSHFPCTIAESTLRTSMDYGFRGTLPTRPVRAPSIQFLSIDSHVCSMLPSDLASRR